MRRLATASSSRWGTPSTNSTARAPVSRTSTTRSTISWRRIHAIGKKKKWTKFCRQHHQCKSEVSRQSTVTKSCNLILKVTRTKTLSYRKSRRRAPSAGTKERTNWTTQCTGRATSTTGQWSRATKATSAQVKYCSTISTRLTRGSRERPRPHPARGLHWPVGIWTKDSCLLIQRIARRLAASRRRNSRVSTRSQRRPQSTKTTCRRRWSKSSTTPQSSRWISSTITITQWWICPARFTRPATSPDCTRKTTLEITPKSQMNSSTMVARWGLAIGPTSTALGPKRRMVQARIPQSNQRSWTCRTSHWSRIYVTRNTTIQTSKTRSCTNRICWSRRRQSWIWDRRECRGTATNHCTSKILQINAILR